MATGSLAFIHPFAGGYCGEHKQRCCWRREPVHGSSAHLYRYCADHRQCPSSVGRHLSNAVRDALIVPRNLFKLSHGMNPHLIEAMNYGHIRQFLVSWEHNKSAFERFNIREDDGSFWKMTSYQFRHWLNDIADKGGMPVDVQTRWMGRESPRETLSYHLIFTRMYGDPKQGDEHINCS